MATIRFWEVESAEVATALEKVLAERSKLKNNLDIIADGSILNITTVNDDKDTPGGIDVVVNMFPLLPKEADSGIPVINNPVSPTQFDG